MARMGASIDIERLKEQTQWWGEYRGIRFIVKCTDCKSMQEISNGEAWTYYLVIYRRELSDEDFAKINHEPVPCPWRETQLCYDKYALEHLWWKGGVTWYDRHFDKDGQVSAVEIGCDYSHSWDVGESYCLSEVLSHVERTINELHEFYEDRLLANNDTDEALAKETPA